MLPKENRLKKMKDFELLHKHGQFVGDDIISIKGWQIDPSVAPKRGYMKDDLKIAFVVGTKVSKSAVKRNRLKRQMREVVRLLLKDNQIERGYFIAIMAKPTLLGASFEDIKKSINVLLFRAHVLILTKNKK